MQLTLQRRWLTPISTCGELFIDGARFSFTLELPIKDGKPGSAIPAGTYKVTTYPSPHFSRLMPLLEVPGRETIEIHWGNRPVDTRGCILVGNLHSQGADWIGESRLAFDALWAQAQGPMERGECTITLTDPVNTHDEVQEASSGG